ncbi:MAG TPA: hypothetical protein PLL10_07155 [Elusimicrobiales bacterium]|nr:hypothetical protein [Elusimicrobiales bacterium]
MRKIKVAHVITRLEMGGAQLNTLYTVSHLDHQRFEPALLYGSGGIMDEKAALPPQAKFEVPGLVRRICPAKDLKALLGLRKIFRELRPILCTRIPPRPGFWAVWPRKWKACPC